jgi:DNA-binding response OmpR family regulator
MNAISLTPARRKHILLVEDDAGAAEALARVLSEQYDVVVARDGMEGLAMASKSSPDLIISDVTMPRLDGFAMVRHIRSHLARKVPVIFVSGSNAPADVIAGIRAGARHYLTKPVDLQELESRIARALGS